MVQAVEHARFVDCCAEYAQMCVVATRVFVLLDQLRAQIAALEAPEAADGLSDPENAPDGNNAENAGENSSPQQKVDFFEFAKGESGYGAAEQGERLWAKYQRSRGVEFERKNAFYVGDDKLVRDADTQPVVFAQAVAFVDELLYEDNVALGAFIADAEARARRAYLLKAVEDEDPRQECDLRAKRAELAVLSDAELYSRLGSGARQEYDQTDFGGLVDMTRAVHDMLVAECALLAQKAE